MMSGKVLYLVSCFPRKWRLIAHGRGGHYYSLRATVEILKPEIQNRVICFCTHPSPIVDAIDSDVYNLKIHPFSFFRLIRQYKKHLRDFQPEIVHAFDLTSLFFARLFLKKSSSKVVFTKTAGANPGKFLPPAENLFFYSRKNLNYFNKFWQYNQAQKILAPERVLDFELDDYRQKDVRKDFPPDAFLVFRISRLNSRYSESIEQSFALVRQIRETGKNAFLVLIGPVEQVEVMDMINEKYHGLFKHFPDEEMGIDAHKLLPAADAVVATGRGIMEAAYCGKLLFSQMPGKKLPCMLREDNFEKLFDENFERTEVWEEYSEKENLENILLYLADENKLNEYSEFIRSKAEEFFMIRNKKQEILSFYQNAIPPFRWKRSIFVKHFEITFKAFVLRKF